MRIAIEENVFGNGTVAVEVDGVRVAYLRPLGDGTVKVTVVPYNNFGLSPLRQPSFKCNVQAVLERNRHDFFHLCEEGV